MSTQSPTQASAPSYAPALRRVQAIEGEVSGLMLGRDEVVRAAMVALLANQHIVLLGPPGTGKSMVTELIADRIASPAGRGLRCFSWLMTRFTTPDEIFGPIAPMELKNNRYVRITTNKLPEAELVFLDEIFKSSSAILNALLTVLNERAFDNGPSRVPVPLITCFGASNEMPQGEDLAALFDRFGLRCMVEYVDDSDFAKLLRLAAATAQPTTLPQTDLVALQAAVEALPVPSAVLDQIVQLRKDLAGIGIIASDRRWRQTLGLLRAHALLEDRTVVEEDDLAILKDVLWQAPEQRQEIARIVARISNPTNARAVEIGDEAVSVYDTWQAKQRDPHIPDDQKTTAGVEAVSKLKKLGGELKRLRENTAMHGKSASRVAREEERIRNMTQEVASVALGL